MHEPGFGQQIANPCLTQEISDIMNDLEERLKRLHERYPLVPHTGAGQLSSTVRRMKAEKEMDIPINRRTGFAISVEAGKPANELNEERWERFYEQLCSDLEKRYPDLHASIFKDEVE